MLGQVVVDLLQRGRVQGGRRQQREGRARREGQDQASGERAQRPAARRRGPAVGQPSFHRHRASREQEGVGTPGVVRLAAQDELATIASAAAIMAGRNRRAVSLRRPQISPATQTGVRARPV